MRLLSRIHLRTASETEAPTTPEAEAPTTLEAEAPSTGLRESDNRGTLHDTTDMAVNYWMARMGSPKKDPYVMHVFDRGEDARAALLELPCIHVAEDTGKLICTEVLIYGYWPMEGTYEAMVCGDELSHDLWEQARESFARHGGRLKNELEPEASATAPAHTGGSASNVKFVREERQPNRVGAMCTYRIHEAPDAASAQAFLADNPVTEGLVYVVVETPEGNYCRDIDGMYKE
jgi:hypothetical protein